MKSARLFAFSLLPLFVLPLSLVACGDDDGDDTPTPATTVASTATPATLSATASGTNSATASGTATTPSTSTASVSATASATAAETIPAPANADTSSKTTAANPASPASQPLLQNVRIGVHPEQGGWDRLVFEFSGGLPAAKVEYVASSAQCGSGEAVTVPGTKMLAITFQSAAAHDAAGQPTFIPKSILSSAKTILGVKATCDFEGVVGWVAGIDSQKAFAVSTLTNPPRLVIDVKQ